MPLILDRNAVLEAHADAAARRWVIPTFCTENLTTTEAILSAALEHSVRIGCPDLPVTVAITNQYAHRSQSVNFTHTRRWDIGLRLFLAEIGVLTAESSPFHKLRVMVHLDHTQWDTDKSLLEWDMRGFSSIMFDASGLPFNENIRRTAEFVERHGDSVVVEGACDEIVDAGGAETGNLTSPEAAIRYLKETNVDFMVANLGTEHRAQTADLQYHGDLARAISSHTGSRLVLHGTSSVSLDQLRNLFNDGIAKVNIWTTLERDSSPALFENMVANASMIIGEKAVGRLIADGLLGEKVRRSGKPAISHFTTVYRQDIVFSRMKQIVLDYFELWYV